MPTQNVFSDSGFNESVATIEVLINRHPEIFVDGEIDFTLLKGILSKEAQLAGNESYGFTWAGKGRVQNAAFTGIDSSTVVLNPEQSKHLDTTSNAYIVGDNLKVLQALLPTYRSKIACIFIDPPYNTSNDFIYNDVFKANTEEINQEDGRLDDEGRALQTTTQSDRRHTNWLNMMYPRLRLAKTMLKDDGHIFISIDENEITNLRAMCNEIFGESNFVACFVWVCNKKGRKLQTGASVTKEYILCYTKNTRKNLLIEQAWAAELMPEMYTRPNYTTGRDQHGTFVLKNQLYNTNSRNHEEECPTLIFDLFYHPQKKTFRTQYTEARHKHPIQETEMVNPFADEGFVQIPLHRNAKPSHHYHAWRWSKKKILTESHNLHVDNVKGNWRIWTKLRGKDATHTGLKDVIMGASLGTKQGSKDIENAEQHDDLLHEMFQHPKPVSLVQILIESCTNSDDIILDFFSGSGTTAEAVMTANSRDKGRRKFILIQLDEATFKVNEHGEEVPTKYGKLAYEAGYRSIAEIAQERIRRVETKLQDSKIDFGFQSYFSAATHYRPWKSNIENIKPLEEQMNLQISTPLRDGWTPRSILTESLLSLEIPLPHHPEELSIQGHTIYRIIQKGNRFPYIVAFFETKPITNSLLDWMLQVDQPLHLIAFDNSISDTQRQQYPTIHFHLI